MTEATKKPVFKIKNRIVTRSLLRVLCVLLPVVFLFHYVSQFGAATQARIEAERKNLEFSNRINRAASSTALACGYLLINLLMNSEKSALGWTKHRQQALEEVRQLESFSKTIVDPVKSYHVATLIDQTHRALNIWSQLRAAGSTNEIRDVVTNMKSMRSYFIGLFKLHAYFQKIELDEQTRLAQGIEQAKAELASLNLILNTALILLFALSVYLVFSFSREITDRLKVVVENATRLPLREKLNEAVPGGDEISYLDSVLHQAADKLDQSAQFRKNLLEMVAHDLCSPLTAVNLSLAILQKGPAEVISESTSEKFFSAAKCIEHLVLKANSLLSIERLCANSPDLALADADISKDQDTESLDKNISELSRLIRIEFRTGSGFGSEAARRFRPGIFKKGLVLFLIPLIFSTMMIFSIAQLTQKQARFLDFELKQSEAAVTINQLMMSMSAHLAVVTNYQWYGDSENENLQQPVAKFLPAAAKKLLELVGNDRQTIADVNELLDLDRRENQRLANEKPVAVAIGALPTPAFAAPGRALVIFSIKKMEKIQQLTDRQLEKMAEIRGNEEAVRKQIESYLQVGIFGSWMIALLLLCAFDSDITRRLKVLTANAELLPLRKPLKQNVNGRDEIWYLDFVLHDVSEILDATWQQRKVMMEMLADDLRKPLQETKEYLLQVPEAESGKFDEVRKRHFNFATANVDRVLSLVDALLTIENLEQGKIELVKSEFAARDAAQEAIGSLAALAQDRRVSLSNDCANIQVNADRGRIIQVLVNFLGNAINHSPPETTVRIETSQTPLGVRFDVVDSGPGLSKEMRSKVFERFFQTADSKTKGKGYGLGLAICRMIAEAHGGTVGCDEASTGGCSFYAVFPRMGS